MKNQIEVNNQINTPLPEYAVELNDVAFRYDDESSNAVENLSLKIKRGEFVSILGHNGSGKSTLARLICGFIECDSGDVTVWGMDPSDPDLISEVRRHAGIVFQNPDNQTVASIVEDDVAFGPENLGLSREEIGKRIEWALSVVGMSAFRRSTPARLSGGQKQRVAIAGVLAIKPDVLILDESTAMLDPKGRKEITAVAKRLNEEEGLTVILITHFTEEALLSQRSVVMSGGKIVADGKPEEIFLSGDVERFGLLPPAIPAACAYLSKNGLPVEPCLRVEELAAALKSIADEKGVKCLSQPHIPAPIAKNGGEWDISVRDLSYTYSKKSPFATHALKGVSLDVSEGEFFGIIGQTGSGKSTLVQHLNALIKLPQAEKHYKKPKAKKGVTPPAEPEITVGKFVLSNRKCDFSALRADVGVVFQYPEYQLFASTVAEDVAFGLKNFRKGLSEEEIRQAVAQSLAAVGLNIDEVGEKSPFELSGGQKRRVAIAGVICTRPHILVLDEPAAGLDPVGKREIMRLLHSFHGDWCKTVIIVSHDMDEISENCTRACVLADGEIVACATPAEIFKDGEGLLSLGLDRPVAAKLISALEELGVEVSCDYTVKGLLSAALNSLNGGDQNA